MNTKSICFAWGCVTWLVLLSILGHNAWADRHEDETTPQEWSALTAMFQGYLEKSREDFEAIMAPLESLRPFEIALAPDGLDVRWSPEAEETKAPDSLTERIRPHLEKTYTRSLQYQPGLVQFMPYGAALDYKRRSILVLIIYSDKNRGVPECTEALLLEHKEPFGVCWLSLEPENWYVEMSWTFSEHERAAYEKSIK